VNYIIADLDEQSCSALKKILDDHEILDFQGRFTSMDAIFNSIGENPPDIAFIRMGQAKLNAFKLIGKMNEVNPNSMIILFGSQATYAVEAFECGADGFLLMPFNEGKTERLLQRCMQRRMHAC